VVATPKPTPGVTKPTFPKAPSFVINTSKGYNADIKTDKGDIIIQLNAKAAPLTVNNFVFLAQQHYFDGLTCHRVIPGFVAQCGDPKGDGTGGPGYTIPDEPSPLKHGLGAIAMAKSGPNTAGSQFYITLAPQPQLDGGYTVFGQVISGMNVVQQLAPRDPMANPTAPPGDRIVSVTIMETDTTPTPVAAAPAAPAPVAATPAR
jgi:cyclophilin family peptidyl-prolyl cis-trans isomerase